MVKILLLGLSGDSGCQVAALGLHDKLVKILTANELVYAPTLIDAKEIPEKIDVAIIEGGLRTEHEIEVIKKIRSNSSIMIAIGSCACFGGIPGLANLKEGKILLNKIYAEQKGTTLGQLPLIDTLLPEQIPIHSSVKVEYTIPGCPPEVGDIANTLVSLLNGNQPPIISTDVCEKCPRERVGTYASKLIRIHEDVSDPKRCLLEQGFLCMGPATMGGCGAPCPSAGMPCDGCRGPTIKNSDQGLTMLDALTSLISQVKDDFDLSQNVGILYRYTYPDSNLVKLFKGGEKNE